jgi:hypothetical protein
MTDLAAFARDVLALAAVWREEPELQAAGGRLQALAARHGVASPS